MDNFKNMIDFEAFSAIIGYYTAYYENEGVSEFVLKEYLDSHIRGKEHIFKLFGGKLKIEREIDVTVTSYEIQEKKMELRNSLFQNKKFIFATALLEHLNTDEFISNTLQRDFQIFDVKVPKGMKVSKALSKLVLPEHAHEVTVKHSMVYQSLFTKGKAVISIDPIDYITMSSNSSGWKSCHRLNGGEYAAGPLAYLADSSSVICYIESSKPCSIMWCGDQYTHSNKTWRQIALVSSDSTYSTQERQYPNENSINAKAIADMFKELFEKANGKSYQKSEEGVDTLWDLHTDFAELEDETACYYNDTRHEMYEDGYVVYPSDKCISDLIASDQKPLKGALAMCLCCGHTLYDANSPFCDSCFDCNDDDEW